MHFALFSAQVIFSQTSELLERQSSMASSTEEVSGTGNDLSTDSKGGQGGGGAGGGGGHDTTDTEQKFGMYMREFDFLEYELESLEVSVTNQGWRRSPKKLLKRTTYIVDVNFVFDKNANLKFGIVLTFPIFGEIRGKLS